MGLGEGSVCARGSARGLIRPVAGDRDEQLLRSAVHRHVARQGLAPAVDAHDQVGGDCGGASPGPAVRKIVKPPFTRRKKRRNGFIAGREGEALYRPWLSFPLTLQPPPSPHRTKSADRVLLPPRESAHRS